MANNKVELSDGSVLIDLSQDTVTSSDHIMSGYVGHLASGLQVTGTGNNYVMPDWEAEEVTDSESGEITGYEDGYILNKPAIKAGEGENSITEGMIEDDNDSKVYTIYLTGEAGATTFTYTTEDETTKNEIAEKANAIPSVGIVYSPTGSNSLYRTSRISKIDSENSTITLKNIINTKTRAVENQQAFIYYHSKNIAISPYCHAEGKSTFAYLGSAHAEGVFTAATGSYSHAEGYATTAMLQYSHAEGNKTRASGLGAHAEGSLTTADSGYTHAEGYYTKALDQSCHSEGHNTIASKAASHAEGRNTEASGSCSHAEGNFALASGLGSHAEGNVYYVYINLTGEPNATTYNFTQNYSSGTILLLKMAHTKIISDTAYNNFNLNTSSYSTITNIDFDNSTITVDTTLSDTAISDAQYYIYIRTEANGMASHAEGLSSLASGEGSHAEGTRAVASGIASHAEGVSTKASGDNSHASGELTTAATRTQTVIGTYNTPDDTTTNLHPSQFSGFGKYAFIVGNGYDTGGTSNAHTLDWQGNGWYAGKLTVGSAPTNNMDVATKQYVDNSVPDLSGYVITSNLASLVNPLIQAALANYDGGGANIWKDKKVCVFGDSIGAGYNNNNYSFIDVLSESGVFASVHKNCLSGSTTATLNARLQESSTEIANADIIFCEYQANDISGIISGDLTTSQLVTAVRTCNTYIRNLNATCSIVWLPLTVLHFDKVGGTNASYYKAWASALYPVFAELGISMLPIYDTLVAGHALSDGRHPNNSGHQVIADLIMQTPLGYTNYPTELLTEWTGGNY